MSAILNYLYNWISAMPQANSGIIAFILIIIALVVATPPDNTAPTDTEGW